MRKIRQIVFLLFDVKELLGSTLNTLQMTVLTKYGGKAGITPK